jgi:hypothetical protein
MSVLPSRASGHAPLPWKLLFKLINPVQSLRQQSASLPALVPWLLLHFLLGVVCFTQ